MAEESRPHVVVVGGGFGGLECARRLQKTNVRVTLVDRVNHHLFQPLLYQVATSVLSPGDISAPIRSVVSSPTTKVLLANAEAVDLDRKVLICDTGELAFDILVVAAGATHSYFGHEEWAQHAPGLKTLDDAVEIRRRVLLAFEAAERETDPIKRKEWLTFAVIGGGPTGVELAGALADLARHTLRREFHHIDTADARIILLEGLPRVLTMYPEKLSARATRDLEREGVEVRTGAMVTDVQATGVRVGTEWICARTILWGAGVAASSLTRSLEAPVDRAGRVEVTPLLQLPGRDDVYVIGDAARVMQDGQMVPGVAPAAKQMGHYVAKAIKARGTGKTVAPFRYVDKGSFAVIGRGAAVGVTLKEKVRMSGWLAFITWALVHVLYLIGFRNRASVLLEWTYYFFTGRRRVRLITGGPSYGLPPIGPKSPAAAPRPPPEQETHV